MGIQLNESHSLSLDIIMRNQIYKVIFHDFPWFENDHANRFLRLKPNISYLRNRTYKQFLTLDNLTEIPVAQICQILLQVIGKDNGNYSGLLWLDLLFCINGIFQLVILFLCRHIVHSKPWRRFHP